MPGTWHRAVKLLLQVAFVRGFDSLPSSSLSSVVLACVVTRNPAARRRRFFAAFSRRRGLLSKIRGRDERDAALPRAQGSCSVHLSPEVW